MNIIGTKIATGLIGTAALGGMMVPTGQMIKENIQPQNDNNAAIIEKAQMQDSEKEKEMSNGERQEFGEMEKMDGTNMETPPEKPEVDDDGTKYPKPDGEMQMKDGELPELPEGAEMGNLPEKPSDDDDGTKFAKPNDSETKNFESAPLKPSDDDDGTKYPIQNNQ